MTATIVGPDIDVDEFIVLDSDLNEAVPCETAWPCGNDAEYRLIKKCCGNASLICEDCLFRAKDIMTNMVYIMVKCITCGGITYPKQFGDFYTVKKLGKNTSPSA